MAGVMIDSPLYDTGRRLIQRSILQQKDSAQYDTALSQSRKTGITWRNLIKIENILTHYLVAQAGSN